MSPRDVFIFVNGILTRPGDAKGWTDRAVHWFNRNVPGSASYPFEYYSPALLRFVFQRGHVDDLAETIAQYGPDFRLHLVGHSNGCELIRRALLLTSAKIASVHFISAAVDADLAAGGLVERLERGQIGELFLLCSKGDSVLRYLAPASRVLSFGLLGYGSLGQTGAKHTQTAGVRHVWREDLGHSDWFSPQEFETTMRTVHAQAANPELHLV